LRQGAKGAPPVFYLPKVPSLFRFLFVLLAALCVSGEARAGQLLISAAASLTDVLNEVAAMYEKSGRASVTYNFGGSGTLQRQIEHGAPADVFISAAKDAIDSLEKQDLIARDTRVNLAGNTLVLVVPAQATRVNSYIDLAADRVKQIAIGDPRTVPAGGYAMECFNFLGLGAKVEPKLVRLLDVRQVLAAVEIGNADAGVIYYTDTLRRERIRVAQVAPQGSHSPIIYPAAVLRSSKHQELARAFLTFLQSEPVQAAFERCGFTILR
jgi:molybdate transport system substrate-binding protein